MLTAVLQHHMLEAGLPAGHFAWTLLGGGRAHMLQQAVESLRWSPSLSQDGFLLGGPSNDAPSSLDNFPALKNLSICEMPVLSRCHTSG